MKLVELQIDHRFIIWLMIAMITFCSIRFLFQPWILSTQVYYRKIFKNDASPKKISKMSGDFFSVNFMQIFSLILQATYILVSQKMIVLQNILMIQAMWKLDQQKDKKTLLILIQTAKMKLMVMENAPLLLHKSGLKTTFHEN